MPSSAPSSSSSSSSRHHHHHRDEKKHSKKDSKKSKKHDKKKTKKKKHHHSKHHRKHRFVVLSALPENRLDSDEHCVASFQPNLAFSLLLGVCRGAFENFCAAGFHHTAVAANPAEAAIAAVEATATASRSSSRRPGRR